MDFAIADADLQVQASFAISRRIFKWRLSNIRLRIGSIRSLPERYEYLRSKDSALPHAAIKAMGQEQDFAIMKGTPGANSQQPA
jgi:hypothetical protein